MLRRLVLALSLVALSACNEATNPSDLKNQSFTLAPGQSRTTAGAAIRILFDGVSGDSRCPADVVCIQGGDAIVRILARSPGATERSYDLHTGNLQPVTHDGATITLVQLVPYPFSSGTIAPSEYRVTLLESE